MSLSPADRTEILRMYRDGFKLREISDLYTVSAAYICSLADEAGLERRMSPDLRVKLSTAARKRHWGR